MDWKAVGQKIVAAGAPILGGALLGPAGAAIGAVLAGELKADATPEAVLAAMDDPSVDKVRLLEIQTKHAETLESFKLQTLQANQQHTQALRTADNAELAIVTADVQQARSVHRDHWMPWVLTLVLAAMVAGLTVALMYFAIPNTNRDIIVYIAGQLVTAFLTGVAYWLGTSIGSARKQQTIESKL